MIKWQSIKEGDVLYDWHKQKMGNTKVTRMGCWSVRIVSIDRDRDSAMVSWNSNPPERWPKSKIQKIHVDRYVSPAPPRII